jgi:hypothetical protein
VVLLLPEEGVLTVKTGYPPEDQLDGADLAAANWAWGNDRTAGARLGHAAGRQAAVPADADRPWPDRGDRDRR